MIRGARLALAALFLAPSCGRDVILGGDLPCQDNPCGAPCTIDPCAEMPPYQPCMGKKCGEPCTLCDPKDPMCVEGPPKTCDPTATCVPGLPMCP
jgi:hypothetical protein